MLLIRRQVRLFTTIGKISSADLKASVPRPRSLIIDVREPHEIEATGHVSGLVVGEVVVFA